MDSCIAITGMHALLQICCSLYKYSLGRSVTNKTDTNSVWVWALTPSRSLPISREIGVEKLGCFPSIWTEDLSHINPMTHTSTPWPGICQASLCHCLGSNFVPKWMFAWWRNRILASARVGVIGLKLLLFWRTILIRYCFLYYNHTLRQL